MHPAIAQVFQYFAYAHLPPHLQAVSKPCHDLAAAMIATLPASPEVTVGLRKLLEAKDCFVRAAVPNASEASAALQPQDTLPREERTF
jgi:hypothetical protein